MKLAKIKPDEESMLEFSMEIFGIQPGIPISTRFIIESKTYDIICRSEIVDDLVKVNIPILSNILESGEYNVKLEVILENKIFTPLKESIAIENMPEFNIGKNSIKIKQNESRVADIKISPNKEKKTELKSYLDEGYKIVQFGDYNILKKLNYYVGIVLNEDKILTPIDKKTRHITLSSLVEAIEAGN
jgi:hypothetical protein